MKKIIILLFMGAGLSMAAQSAVDKQEEIQISFRVSGNCAMCKKRIEDATKVKGVSFANWDIQSKILELRYHPSIISEDQIHQKIADAGHDTEKKKAKDEIYDKLPACCKYRKDAEEAHSGENSNAVEANHVMGIIMEEDDRGNFKPLPGANIILSGSSRGIATDEHGFFSLPLEKDTAVIIVSYTGFQSKSIGVRPGDHLNITLNTAKPLEGIKVMSVRKPSYVSPLSVLRTQVITEKELYKAACCNLSESFETSPSVDVSYNDAVTGSRQIQLLGLSGNYTQLTLESLPGPRGIATPLGLNFIPGTWVESIQLSKGVGSVANGFESIAGQINVELKKPMTGEKLYANAYVNSMGKTDLNLDLSRHAGKKWATSLLLHDAFLNNKVDFNKDGFRDLPTGNLFTLMNRWQFDSQKGWMGQAGIRVLRDNKTGGEMSFDPGEDKLTSNHYGLGIETKRYEVFTKTGYVFPEKKYKSIGLQLSAFHHDQDSYFGTTVYNASQDNFYANLIYQSIISNTNHKFRAGLSVVSDKYDELFRNTSYKRTETVPGAFFEYTYSPGEKYSLILGIRGDQNNLFGFFVTPRMHMRYEPIKGTVIRLAAGRGQRTANIFAENMGVLVSSRAVSISGPSGTKAYGLDPEIAWNEGISIDQRFRLFNRNGSVGMDFFRTDFHNQVIADVDASAHELNFYNSKGKSYSNSFQAELNYELLQKLDLRLAYRLFDVKASYHGQLLQRPLLSKHRGFANLAYQAGKWKFDYTITFNGARRIPYTGDNPASYTLPAQSPSYILMNAQVSVSVGNKLPVDLYLGSENITNYYQHRVILAADQPFSGYFDASLVWGPVSGRMFYTGLRFKII